MTGPDPFDLIDAQCHHGNDPGSCRDCYNEDPWSEPRWQEAGYSASSPPSPSTPPRESRETRSDLRKPGPDEGWGGRGEWGELSENQARPDPFERIWATDHGHRLHQIKEAAQARRVAPWAMLGAVLVQVATACPVDTHLPPIIGSKGSLNLFAGLVGPSGGGKSAAIAAAAEYLPYATERRGIGTGEGVAAHFTTYDREAKQPVLVDKVDRRLLFVVQEVDTLTALGNRKGATILPVIRSAFSGEALGNQNADPARRHHIPAHAYRLGLIMGIQPLRAGPLLNDVDAGTPQRFLWLPSLDPLAPREPPEWPGALADWKPPTQWAPELPVCEVARDTITDAQYQRLRGEDGSDPLDGHRLYLRLKVAAALAILARRDRAAVTEADWDVAGIIIAKSDSTRRRVQSDLDRANASSDVARGLASGVRTAIAEEEVTRHRETRARDGVLRKIDAARGEWVKRKALRSHLAKELRAQFHSVIDDLESEGVIESRQAPGLEYRRCPGRPR